MANAREIQSRMNSIKSTMKITNAMYTISSSKLKKARKNLTDTEPYFYALQRTISRIVRHTPEIEDPYFDTRPQIKPEDKKIGYIVVQRPCGRIQSQRIQDGAGTDRQGRKSHAVRGR